MSPPHLFALTKGVNICGNRSLDRQIVGESESGEGKIMAIAYKLIGLAGLLAAAAAPSVAGAQVLTQHDVSLHMGLAIAEEAVAECEKAGNSVSVAVVDRVGRLRVFLQGDKASPHNIELARRKAYTARTFGRSSADWAKRTVDVPELAGQRSLKDVIPLRGGVPIKIGDETIGAVGVSGSSSEGDEKCAMAGVAKVADQLK
jgi:uncharacterized protein GlcG (DUF336 family)